MKIWEENLGYPAFFKEKKDWKKAVLKVSCQFRYFSRKKTRNGNEKKNLSRNQGCEFSRLSLARRSKWRGDERRLYWDSPIGFSGSGICQDSGMLKQNGARFGIESTRGMLDANKSHRDYEIEQKYGSERPIEEPYWGPSVSTG